MEGEELREEGELGGGAGPQMLLPTPSFMASEDEDLGLGHLSFCYLPCVSIRCTSALFRDRPERREKGELATSRHRANGGRRKMDKIYAAIVNIG